VHQRLALGKKGEAADILVMTATPIPRTLVLTYFGDMDVSNLREKPLGRQTIETRAIPLDRMEELVARLQRALSNGARVFWVCPLVEESEALDVAAAQDRFLHLQEVFGDKVGLVHGKMKSGYKDSAMTAFADGEIQILVATTVIEVGVDIPQATIMVIEHAERFGLTQLHQLRGRVGRSGAKSSCLLLYRVPLGETAKARIAIMRETDDGFRMPRKTCACAARARSSARNNLACRDSAWPISPRMGHCWRWRARKQREPPARRPARRGLAPPPQYIRAWRSDPASGGGVGMSQAR
jgi:ATP-dependent DNA helicase RecG